MPRTGEVLALRGRDKHSGTADRAVAPAVTGPAAARAGPAESARDPGAPQAEVQVRRLVSTVAASVLAVPLVSAIDVVRIAGPAARAVAPVLRHVPLAGVDAASLADAAPTASAQDLRPGGRTAVKPARPAVLTAQLDVEPFQTLGVTWDVGGGSGDVAVQVRWRTDGGDADGTWSEWTALDTEQAPGSEPGGPAVRPGTDPLWTGPADGVQVRVDAARAVRGLRLDLIDPGRSGYDENVDAAPAGAAAAAAPTPRVYSRAQWGADESRRRGTVTYNGTIQAGVLHHTAGMNNYSSGQVPSIIRGDYAYHLSRGWNDIGYNFLVDRFGRVWEGRAGGLDRAVQGAHAAGFNVNTVGVSVLGNYESAKANDAIIDAIARIFAWKLDLHHRDPLGTTELVSQSSDGTSRYKVGTRVTKPVIMGHRDVGYTACPGKNLYPHLAAIRKKAVAYMGAALINPALSASSVPVGRGVSLTVTTLLATSWRIDAREVCTNADSGSSWGRTPGRWRGAIPWTGRIARGGIHVLTASGRAGAAVARPVKATVTVVPPAPPPMPAGTPVVAAGGYVPVPMARILNTRSGAVQPLGPGGRVDLPVTGRAGVPASGVSAVALTVSTQCPTAAGFVSVVPSVPTSTWRGSITDAQWVGRSATILVPVSSNGKVSIRNSAGIVNVAVDLVGYVSTSATARTVLPSAPTPLGAVNDVVAARGDRSPALPTIGGVAPSSVRAAWVDVHTTAAGSGGLVFGSPAGGLAVAQSVAYAKGSADHLVLAPVVGGKVLLRNTGGGPVTLTMTVVAVQRASGAGSTLTTLGSSWRLADTRNTAPVTGAGLTVDATVSGGPVPAGADAVVAVVTGTATGARARMSVAAAGAPAPAHAALDVPAGATVGNTVVLPLDADGRAVLRASAPTLTVVDVVGYLS